MNMNASAMIGLSGQDEFAKFDAIDFSQLRPYDMDRNDLRLTWLLEST
jgi:hypothetical protein